MGWDSASLPDHVRRLIPKEQRDKLHVPTNTDVAEKVTAKNESELQDQIASYLRVREIPYSKPAFGKKSTVAPGWPDFTFPWRGRFVTFETKVATKQTKEQEQAQRDIERHGGFYFIVRSIEQAKEILDGFNAIGTVQCLG